MNTILLNPDMCTFCNHLRCNKTKKPWLYTCDVTLEKVCRVYNCRYFQEGRNDFSDVLDNIIQDNHVQVIQTTVGELKQALIEIKKELSKDSEVDFYE
jgi:hypothetical protein